VIDKGPAGGKEDYRTFEGDGGKGNEEGWVQATIIMWKTQGGIHLTKGGRVGTNQKKEGDRRAKKDYERARERGWKREIAAGGGINTLKNEREKRKYKRPSSCEIH